MAASWGMVGGSLLLGLGLGIGGWWSYHYRKRQWGDQTCQQVQQWLRHWQHQWLNDLQVLLAYQQLGRLAELTDYLQRMKDRSRWQQRLFSLSYPPLIWFLLTWEQSLAVGTTLSWQVEALVGKLAAGEARRLRWVLQKLRMEVEWIAPTQLTLKIYRLPQTLSLQITLPASAAHRLLRRLRRQRLLGWRGVVWQRRNPEVIEGHIPRWGWCWANPWQGEMDGAGRSGEYSCTGGTGR